MNKCQTTRENTTEEDGNSDKAKKIYEWDLKKKKNNQEVKALKIQSLRSDWCKTARGVHLHVSRISLAMK